MPSPPICVIEGCEQPAIVKKWGWCSKHYSRWHRHGDPLYVAHAHFYGTTLERFWHYVDRRPDGHWLWTGPRNTAQAGRDYGLLFDSDRGRNVLAHRFSYELHKGPIPEGMEPDHTCEVPACVAPHHLEAVTHLVNVQRGKRWREPRPEPAPRLCSVEGCDRPVDSWGWCAGHYARWKAHGDVQADRPLRQWTRHHRPPSVNP